MGGWIKPLQTLSQGLVLTLRFRLALSLTIFGHYLNFFGVPKTGMKYIADRIIIFLLIEITLICILQRGAGTARDINANPNEYQLNHRLLKF